MKLRLVLVTASVVAVCTSCGTARFAGGEDSVVAGFYPLAFAARQVGGPGLDVVDLTPPGAEPHDLEPTPREVAGIREAQVVLLLGRGFQPQLEEAAGAAQNVVRLLDTPGLGVHPNGDPHVWLDPVRFARLITRVGAVLRRPGAARRLAARLQALDGEYRRGLAHCARRDIVTSHEAFAYLAERYGLRHVAIAGLSPEAEPSPGKLADVAALVRARGVTTIFFETLVSPRIAETVARETGAKTARLDPIEGLTPAERARGESYLSLMRENLAALRTGLGCR